MKDYTRRSDAVKDALLMANKAGIKVLRRRDKDG